MKKATTTIFIGERINVRFVINTRDYINTRFWLDQLHFEYDAENLTKENAGEYPYRADTPEVIFTVRDLYIERAALLAAALSATNGL